MREVEMRVKWTQKIQLKVREDEWNELGKGNVPNRVQNIIDNADWSEPYEQEIPELYDINTGEIQIDDY